MATAPDDERETRTDRNTRQTRHARNRALVVAHWPLISERRDQGFALSDIWRQLTMAAAPATMTYKAFRAHTRGYTDAMAQRIAHLKLTGSDGRTREAEGTTVEPNPDPPVMSNKERFRLAREAKAKEEAEAAAAPPPTRHKPDMSMIAGGEIWMSNLGRVRVRELAALNLKLGAGEVSEADARPILEAARREAWSKRLGIRADELTEDDMSGRWY